MGSLLEKHKAGTNKNQKQSLRYYHIYLFWNKVIVNSTHVMKKIVHGALQQARDLKTF